MVDRGVLVQYERMEELFSGRDGSEARAIHPFHVGAVKLPKVSLKIHLPVLEALKSGGQF